MRKQVRENKKMSPVAMMFSVTFDTDTLFTFPLSPEMIKKVTFLATTISLFEQAVPVMISEN